MTNELDSHPVNSDIWTHSSDDHRHPGWIHFAILFSLIVAGIILGSFSSISFKISSEIKSTEPSYGINYFWVGIVVQQIGSIWFGAWGVISGIIFPFISNTVTKASILTSLAYIPSNFIQSFLPAYIFRRLKLNPGLENIRDYVYLIVYMFVSNILGASWSVFVLVVVLGQVAREDAYLNFIGWFGGNMVAGLTFNIILLKALSNTIIKSKLFVKRWWV